jgi:hypothetical protein
MYQENEARLHIYTLRDLQVVMLHNLQERYMVNLAIYGNQSDTRLFHPPTYNSHLTTPLGFNYDSRISGSIVVMIEAYIL